jgi:type IV pilus assembly protein PilC
MNFQYKARDNRGRVVEASAQADSPQDLKARLASRGMSVIEVRQSGQAGAGGGGKVVPINAKGAAAVPMEFKIPPGVQKLFEPKVGLKDMVIFSRQFASMVKAGVAILRGLSVMVEQCENKKMKEVLDSVRRSVESGLSLSDALDKHRDVFDRLYVAMVRAGEAGGILEEVLSRLADFLEARSRLTQKVQAAMYYPVAVMIVAILVLWGMLTFILPVFKNIFSSMGAELPAFTNMLLSLSEVVRSPWMLVFLAACGAAAWGIKQWYKTEIGQMKIDSLILRLPVFGDLLKKVAIARFSRTFGTLVRSGVPMLSALEVVKETAGNAVIQKSIENIHTEVRQGGTISKPLSKDKLFPPMVTQMIAIGEETGKLDDMLQKIADFYDVEVENSVEALTSLLEPIMVVGIGGIVGSVVVGMYLPIFTIIQKIH